MGHLPPLPRTDPGRLMTDDLTAEQTKLMRDHQRANRAALPAYDARRPCPKCGNDQCSTEWRLDNDRSFGFDPAGAAYGEYIYRRCGRCDYRWCERPLDTEAANADDHG